MPYGFSRAFWGSMTGGYALAALGGDLSFLRKYLDQQA